MSELSHHIKMHNKLGINGGYGGNAIPVNSAAELTAAVENYAGREVETHAYLSTNIIAIAGIAVVTLSGETLRTDEQVRVGDLFKINGGTRYYKIKGIPNETTIIPWEPILAGDAFTGTGDITFYRLDRVTLILMPDQYTGAFRLTRGIDLRGSGPRSTNICEIAGVPYNPIYNFGDNVISNLSLGPTDDWSSCDGGITAIDWTTPFLGAQISWDNTNHCAGQEGLITNCELAILNLGGDHNGGTASLPFIPASRVILKSNIIRNDSYTLSDTPNTSSVGDREPIDNTYGDETNSFIDLIDNNLILEHGWESDQTPLQAGGYDFNQNATYNIVGGSIETRGDVGIDPTLFNVSAIRVQSSTGKVIVNAGGGLDVKWSNTGGAGNNSYGIEANSECDINVTNANIEVSGTNGTGIYNNHASAVVNLRHSRVKGSTNSINNNAGTVNAVIATSANSGDVTEIGTTSGTITRAVT